MNQLPYYAVIFTSVKKAESAEYNSMAEKMEKLSSQQTGYLGIQSVRGADGFGITISYWQSLEDISKWKANLEHREAQESGKNNWYTGYEVRICKVERQYSFGEI
jgi:heme-degrading monooxygenase HmoA